MQLQLTTFSNGISSETQLPKFHPNSYSLVAYTQIKIYVKIQSTNEPSSDIARKIYNCT